MDPEVIKDLQTQINELNNVLASFSSTMTGMSRSLKDATQTYNDNTNEKNKNTQSSTTGSAATTNLKNAQQTADKLIQDAAANFSRALQSGKQAVVQFSSAVLSSEEGMAKYGKASESIGESAFSIGRNFGILGTVLGGAFSIFTKAVSESFKLTDNIIQFRDGFAKASGVMPVTAGELGNLAKQARFSLDDMQKLAKTTNSLGQSLLGFGGYAGEGAVKFMRVAAVSDKTRRQYERMGISQEELLDSQAKYLQMQSVSGQAQANQRKTTKRLQQESLAYADNLARMSALTGKSKESIQAEREQAMLEYEEQLKILEENKRIADLRKDGRFDEANAIEKEQRDRRKAIEVYTDTMGAYTGNLVGRVLRQGGYDQTTAILKARGDDILGLGEAMKKTNGDVSNLVIGSAEKSRRNIEQNAERFNTAIQFVGTELGNQLVADKEAVIRLNSYTGASLKDSLGRIKKAEEEKKQPGTDPYADNIAGMSSFERESKAKLQTLLEKIDPLRHGLDMLKKAAYAAAAVAGAVIVGKAVSSMLGFSRPAAGAMSVAATGAGAATTGAATAGALGTSLSETTVAAPKPTALPTPTIPPKIRKADLLDKKGRVLQGGALDARLQKLSKTAPQPTKLDKDDGTFGGIVDALKRAGKSSAQVIKGAGALSIATIELAAGLTVATTLIGAGIIKFVRGLNALDDLDGKNLIQVGLGMAGLGAGVLAMGAGTIAQSVGNIAKFFTGGKDPLVQAAEMLTKLGRMNLDRKKIEDNGAAMMAFAKAMMAISALGAATGIANAVKGVYQTVAGFFGQNKLPYEEIDEFSKKNINTAKVKENSEALAAFGKAMASYKGSSSKQRAAAIADAMTGFFNATPPYVQMIIFSMLNLNTENVKKNSSAFKLFAEAMSSYKGFGSNSGAAGTAIAEATAGFFNATPPYVQMLIFSMLDVNAKKVKNNATSFKVFAEAISAYKGYGSNSGAAGAAIAEAVSGFLNVNPPFDQLVRFSELPVNHKGARRNSRSFVSFAEAMAAYKGLGSPTSTIATALADATSKFFKVRPPLEQAVYFSNLKINPDRTKTNAKSFVLFSEAMASYKGGQGLLSAVSTIAAAGLNKLFGQDSAIDAFYTFSKKDFGPKAAENARAFLNFSKAMGILSGGSSSAYDTGAGIGAGIVGAIAGAGAAAANIVSDALGLSNPGPDSKVLNFIGKIESGNSYNKLVGGKVKNDPPLTDMTVAQVMQFQDTMRARGHETTALGKYQIIKGTLAGVVKSGAINVNDKFNAQTQDRAAIQLMNMRGRERFKSGKLSTDAYANNLAKEWASLPMPNGRSYYAGQGSNKSLVPRSEFIGALQAKKGGLFTGPSTGYPMELHGTEMVIPQMSPNSLLMKLAKTNEAVANLGSVIEAIQAQVSTDVLPSAPSSEKSTSTTFLNPQMIATLANKFDSVITILSESDDVQDKLLKHSLV